MCSTLSGRGPTHLPTLDNCRYPHKTTGLAVNGVRCSENACSRSLFCSLFEPEHVRLFCLHLFAFAVRAVLCSRRCSLFMLCSRSCSLHNLPLPGLEVFAFALAGHRRLPARGHEGPRSSNNPSPANPTNGQAQPSCVRVVFASCSRSRSQSCDVRVRVRVGRS